jgi:hypothetical protein
MMKRSKANEKSNELRMSKNTVSLYQPMNRNLHILTATVLYSLFIAIESAYAQTNTAFVYQGRLNDGGTNANGEYDLLFIVYDAPFFGSPVGSIITNSTTVNGGLFTTTLDFGPGVFTGRNLWLQVGVRTNGSESEFTTLSPRQPILPTPYAITAGSAATAAYAAFATNANNFSGSLAGSVTGPQTATVVASVGGQSAASVASGVVAANAATTANTPSTIVKRDAGGSFAGASLTLSGTNFASDFRLVNGASRQSVVSSFETNGLRIVRGNVNKDGTIYNGTGFSVVKNGTGSYTIIFTSAFSDVPSVACQIGNPSAGTVTTSAVNPNTLSVYTWSGSSLSDNNFTLIAIGGR